MTELKAHGPHMVVPKAHEHGGQRCSFMQHLYASTIRPTSISTEKLVVALMCGIVRWSLGACSSAMRLEPNQLFRAPSIYFQVAICYLSATNCIWGAYIVLTR